MRVSVIRDSCFAIKTEFGSARIDGTHPRGPAGVPVRFDLRDEVLISRENHQQHEVSHQKEIDRRKDGKNGVIAR